MEGEVRRIESDYFRMVRDPHIVWNPKMYVTAPGVSQAGRYLMFHAVMPEELLASPAAQPWSNQPIGIREVFLNFTLERYIHREWVIVERGKDSEGYWEKGYYQYFVFYIPMPKSAQEFASFVVGLAREAGSNGIVDRLEALKKELA